MAKGVLHSLWNAWKKAANRIGVFQSKIILTLVFYLIFTPYALIGRLFGKDPLNFRREKGKYFWEKKRERRPEEYYKQY